MLKLKLQYFGHLMQTANSLKRTPMLGKIEGKRRKKAPEDETVGWHHQFDGHDGFMWSIFHFFIENSPILFFKKKFTKERLICKFTNWFLNKQNRTCCIKVQHLKIHIYPNAKQMVIKISSKEGNFFLRINPAAEFTNPFVPVVNSDTNHSSSDNSNSRFPLLQFTASIS